MILLILQVRKVMAVKVEWSTDGHKLAYGGPGSLDAKPKISVMILPINQNGYFLLAWWRDRRV